MSNQAHGKVDPPGFSHESRKRERTESPCKGDLVGYSSASPSLKRKKGKSVTPIKSPSRKRSLPRSKSPRRKKKQRSQSRRRSYSRSPTPHHRRDRRRRHRSHSRYHSHSRSPYYYRGYRSRTRSRSRSHHCRHHHDRCRRSQSPSQYSRSYSPPKSISGSPHRSRTPPELRTLEIVKQVVDVLRQDPQPTLTPAPAPAPTDTVDTSKSDAASAVPPLTGHTRELVNNYTTENSSKKEALAPPILEHLNPVLEFWWWNLPSREEIKQLLEDCCRPENCDAVCKVWVDDEIFQRCGPSGRSNDQDLRYINHSLTRGAQPLVSLWNELIREESSVQDNKSVTDPAEGPTDATLSLPDGFSLNLTQLRSLLDLSLQVLGLTNAQIITKRKEIMKSSLNQQYQDLCNKNCKFTYKMFGDNLKQQMDDINKLNKLGREVTTTKHRSPAAQAWWKRNNQSKQHFLQDRQQDRRQNSGYGWNRNRNQNRGQKQQKKF